ALPIFELTWRFAKSIADVPAAAWDACANPASSIPAARSCSGQSQSSTAANEYNPFISHNFLAALEASGSVRARAGWEPMHLLAKDASGTLVGAVPCYAKSHSRGEYVFDHGWAEAFEHAGGPYYPKLQVSVPFTPATGRRLLVRAGPNEEAIQASIADAL